MCHGTVSGSGADWCRYIEKFYDMRSQLQKISLRLQVCRNLTPLQNNRSFRNIHR